MLISWQKLPPIELGVRDGASFILCDSNITAMGNLDEVYCTFNLSGPWPKKKKNKI
jgi:hypothetical protein